MADQTVIIDRIQIKRTKVAGRRPTSLADGEEFINHADKFRLIGDGITPVGLLPAYPLRPGIDDVPELQGRLSKKADLDADNRVRLEQVPAEALATPGNPIGDAIEATKDGMLTSAAGARTVKANLLGSPGTAQDVSLASLGQAVSVGITQADLSTFQVRLRSIRLSGFSSVGDVGDGAVYVSSDSAGGPRSIFNGVFYWNLTFASDVYAGHFGAGLGADDSAPMNAAGNYAVANRRRLVLPNTTININQFKPTFPTNGTPFTDGRLWMVGGGAGITTFLKVAGGDTSSPVQVGEAPSTSIKRDVILEGFTIDGRATTTFAGLTLLDVWRGRTRDVEVKNCNVGRQTLGCIYMYHENANCHSNNYSHIDTKLDQSYFAPLIGPSNIHTHVNCLYTENFRRGGIVDWGGMHVYIGCSIEYNGSQIGNADHGGFYIGDNMGYAVPGTVFIGVKFVNCWFENNYGLEQIRIGSGACTVSSTHFIVPPNFTTYGIRNVGGKYSICDGSTFAASFASGNVIDEAGALVGSRIEHGCSLYNVFSDRTKCYIERIPGAGATLKPKTANVANDAFPPTAVDWSGTVVGNSGGNYSVSQPTRLTVLEAGLYRISGSLTVGSNGTGLRQVILARNGAYNSEEWRASSFSTGGLATGLVFPSEIISAAAGDYFEIFPYQNSGAAQPIQGGFFQIERVR